MDSNFEYISVGEYAAFVGRTRQQVYNLIHNGMVSGREFVRGSKRGWLVEKPAGFDTWKKQRELRKQN